MAKWGFMTTETQSVAAVASAQRGFAWRRAAIAFAITLLAIFAFTTAFAAGYAAFHEGRILPGVSVGSVSLAGLDRGAAQQALRRSLPDMGSGRLSVQIGDRQELITYADIGRDYDLPKMLDSAFSIGRSGTPTDQVGQQLRTLMSGVSVPLVVKFDAQRLAELVSQIASAAQVAPSDATITRTGSGYIVTPAVLGQTVDTQQLLARAMAALNNQSPDDATISIDPQVVEPLVSTAVARAAVDRVNSVISLPLTVSVADRSVAIDPETISGWVRLVPAGSGAWDLAIDQGPIAQWVSVFKSEVDVQPKNAGYTFEGTRAVVTPGAPGRTLDAAAAQSQIFDALSARASGTATNSVALSIATVDPNFTTDQAHALVGSVKRLSSWTTHYISSAHNGFGQNIRRPTNLIDGTVVQPGEQFDFLGVAGPITVANGYTDGAAIIHGNTQLDGVLGGGLCSSSTTLFNAALRAGFEIDARRNHAYYIDRYPVGLDATIWVNGGYAQTMAFTNDSEYPILIRGISRRNSVTFSIYGVPDGRQVHIAPAKVWEEKPAWTQYIYTDDPTLVAPGDRKRVEYPFAGFSSSVDVTVTDATGSVISQVTYRSSYRRVIGQVLIGWQEGDPPPGTILEPGKPPDA
jgi:vancomycin resistance protein YoaR